METKERRLEKSEMMDGDNIEMNSIHNLQDIEDIFNEKDTGWKKRFTIKQEF